MPVIIKIAAFTVFQAVISTLVAAAAGLPAAFFTARRKFPGRSFLLSLSSVPFCIPSLLIALGYVTFFGMSGHLNQLLMFLTGVKNPPVTFLYSFTGLIICHGFYNFPLVMSTVSDSWQRLPSDEQNAARILGASEFRVFRTVTIWQLMPSIVSACIPVFLYCYFSFMIVLMFGGIGTTTLEVEMYEQGKVNLNFPAAFKIGALETAIALFIVWIYTLFEHKASSIKGLSFNKPALYQKKVTGLETIPFVCVMFFIILFFICPLGGIVSGSLSSLRLRSSFTFINFIKLLSSEKFLTAFRWTVITAASTGFFCASTAFLYSIFLRSYEGKKISFLFKMLPIIPMAVSSVLTGLLITLLVRQGSFFILVIAQTLLNWPVAFRQIYPQLQKIPQTTLDAAGLLSNSQLDIIWRIYLPTARKSFFRAAGFCFAISAGDATLPLILAIPDFDTLALYTYRLAGRYQFNEACAAGVILGILCAGIFALSSKIKK